MRGLTGFSNSLFGGEYICDVGTGKFAPFLDPSEAQSVKVTCDNPLGKNIITCKHPYREDFVREVDGLELNTILTSTVDPLPTYIPVLDFASLKLGQVPPLFSTVGVTISDIVHGGIRRTAGAYHETPSVRFRTSMLENGSFKDKRVILFLTGIDTLIESLWHKRDVISLFATIKEMGFTICGGINFSVIGGECPFAQALNQKRSLYSSWLAEQKGLIAMPHVYAINDYHLRRWLAWFKLNPTVNFFTMNCQLQKSQNDIAQIVFTIRSILKEIPHLHAVVQGFPFPQMHRFGEVLDRIHFADKTPVKFAHMHRKIVLDGRSGVLRELVGVPDNPSDLMHKNITSRFLYVERIRKHTKGGK